MVVEDEGRHIGRCYIPASLAEHFAEASVVLLEAPLAVRVQITFDEYVSAAQALFCAAFGEEGLFQWLEDIKGSLQRIRKRLGGERLKRVTSLLQAAYDDQLATNDLSAHKKWVEVLLLEYYDPMYDYQLKEKQKKIVFRGGEDDVKDYLVSQENDAVKKGSQNSSSLL